jgi:proteic killer suppression protein
LHGYRESVNVGIMIVSFGDKATADLFHGISSSKVRTLPNQIHEMALYKLDIINAAQNLDDLKSPPGNRLEQLRGDLKGFHSIRINNQWRIAFRWEANSAHDVQIMDYH